MSATSEQPPALGAIITLNGQPYTVHCDCKSLRDALERWLRADALEYVERMLREKTIGKEEAAGQREQTFREIRAGDYSYGSITFARKRVGTDEGIKQDLYQRLLLNQPKVSQEEVAAWVDANGWQASHQVMALADGFSPK